MGFWGSLFRMGAGFHPEQDAMGQVCLAPMPVANDQLPAAFVQQARPFAQPFLNLLLNSLSQQLASPFPQELGQQILPDLRLNDLGHG